MLEHAMNPCPLRHPKPLEYIRGCYSAALSRSIGTQGVTRCLRGLRVEATQGGHPWANPEPLDFGYGTCSPARARGPVTTRHLIGRRMHVAESRLFMVPMAFLSDGSRLGYLARAARGPITHRGTNKNRGPRTGGPAIRVHIHAGPAVRRPEACQ